MSGGNAIPNYTFEYPDLTVVHGEPTYDSLTILLNQLKANARSVRTSIGGGQHGYLGLLLSPAQYAIIAPNTPFQYPPHPGPLQIPAYQLPHVTQQLTSQHSDSVRLFNECHNVAQALRKQVIAAIDPSYIAALKSRQTNTITLPLNEIIDFLFRNYGRVTPAKLVEEEQQLLAWSFDPSLPIVLLFNRIDDLMDLANAAGSPYSAQQVINLGYIIVNKTGKFSTGIREWNRVPHNQRTWEAFCTHFSQAHRELRESGELEIRDTPFNSANLVQDVIDGVQQVLQPAMEASYEAEAHDNMQHAHNISSASTRQTDLMEQMLAMMQLMQQQLNQSPALSSTRPLNQRRPRTKTNKYCWTHGACAHGSSECQNKKAGHQDSATFDNMLGGSNEYVSNRN